MAGIAGNVTARGTVTSPVLLRVLRVIPGAPEALRAELEGVDANALVYAASRHGLAGLLDHWLSAAQKTLPALASENLRRQVHATMAGGMRLRRLLSRANEALRMKGVGPVLLKGYGLGVRLYPAPLLRPSSDVDLLVAPDEMEAARAALLSLGLSPKQDSDDYYPPAYRHHEAFAGSPGMVELHFRLMANWGSAWDGAGVLSRAISTSLEGLKVRYLCPEDEFVYLALHAANHMLGRLGWLYDLKLHILANPSLDWDRVVETAHEARMPAPAFYAMDASVRMVGAAVPETVLQALAPSRIAVAAARLLFSEQHLVESYLDNHKGVWAAAKVLLADSPPSVVLFAARRLVWHGRRAALQRLGSIS